MTFNTFFSYLCSMMSLHNKENGSDSLTFKEFNALNTPMLLTLIVFCWHKYVSIEVSFHLLSVTVLAKSLNYQWFNKMFNNNIFMTILWNFRTCIIFSKAIITSSHIISIMALWQSEKILTLYLCKHFSTSYVLTLKNIFALHHTIMYNPKT
jgi:hypothetical protein